MYRFMGEEEVEIRQMGDLKMVHLYKLGGSDAIAAYYDDNQQMNLCAMDANYSLKKSPASEQGIIRLSAFRLRTDTYYNRKRNF